MNRVIKGGKSYVWVRVGTFSWLIWGENSASLVLPLNNDDMRRTFQSRILVRLLERRNFDNELAFFFPVFAKDTTVGAPPAPTYPMERLYTLMSSMK